MKIAEGTFMWFLQKDSSPLFVCVMVIQYRLEKQEVKLLLWKQEANCTKIYGASSNHRQKENLLTSRKIQALLI